MAKKLLTAAEAQDAVADLIVKGDAPITWEQAFDLMESENAGLVDLTSEYLTFETVGEIQSLVVMGFDFATFQGKQVEVVKVKDRAGNSLINGDKVFVSSCKRLTQLPAWVKVTYVADVKNTQGTYKSLKVQTFLPATL